MTTNYASDYGGGYTLTCILYEGTITIANESIFAGGTVKQPRASFAAAISPGDYVGLFRDTANTFPATMGVPVVTTVAAATGIIGRVVTEPRWARMPASTASVWATMLAGQQYRKAVIEFFNMTSAHGALVEGTTDVLEGAPLVWDLDLDAYKDNGTTQTGAFSLHYMPDATPAVSLVGFGIHGISATTADMVCIDVVA